MKRNQNAPADKGRGNTKFTMEDEIDTLNPNPPEIICNRHCWNITQGGQLIGSFLTRDKAIKFAEGV